MQDQPKAAIATTALQAIARRGLPAPTILRRPAQGEDVVCGGHGNSRSALRLCQRGPRWHAALIGLAERGRRDDHGRGHRCQEPTLLDQSGDVPRNHAAASGRNNSQIATNCSATAATANTTVTVSPCCAKPFDSIITSPIATRITSSQRAILLLRRATKYHSSKLIITPIATATIAIDEGDPRFCTRGSSAAAATI